MIKILPTQGVKMTSEELFKKNDLSPGMKNIFNGCQQSYK